MNEVRLGIIGIGVMGSAHAAEVAAGHVKELRLAAVCDIDIAKREWAARALPSEVRVFSDAHAMIASGAVDAILIAAPHFFHPGMAIEGFAHGLHVLTEKPAGVTLSGVREMNAVAEKAGAVFGIMFNQRTDPLFARAREMVRSGMLGAIKRSVWIVTNWYRTQSYYNSGSWRGTWGGEGGGVLMNQAPHNLDIWQWICGMPSHVRAFCGCGRFHDVEIEDDVTIYAAYPSGATGVFITSTGEDPGTNRLEISGERGKLVLENGRMTHYKLALPEREVCFDMTGALKQGLAVESVTPDQAGSGHNGILQNFTNSILHGTALLAPGVEGANSLAIANAAYLSDWLGQTIAMDEIDTVRFDELLAQKSAESRFAGWVSDENTDMFRPVSRYLEKWAVRW